MVGDSDVLVAASGADGKPACVLGVEFGERHFCDVELVGSIVGSPVGSRGGDLVGSASMAYRFEGLGGLGLVERRPWRVCLRWPLTVASEEGQCCIALRRVRPGKEE